MLAVALLAAPRVARAQVEALCGTVACVAAGSLCFVPEITSPLAPMGYFGLPFEQRRGGMRLGLALFQHAPLGAAFEVDGLFNFNGSGVAHTSALARWTVFREGFGAKWDLSWEPQPVPAGGGLQGVLRLGATLRVGDRAAVEPRVLGHVGLSLEWFAVPPMGLAFTAGALVPVGAGMLMPSEVPIPYFSIDLLLLLAGDQVVSNGMCAFDAAPPPPRPGGRPPATGGGRAPAPAPRRSTASGSCGDCLDPGCGDCGSCGGTPSPPPQRRPVINQ